MQTSINGSGVIRVAVADDHHAIRAGLESALGSQPGLACVGTTADGEQLAPLLYRARPDVVVLDYHLPRADGLTLCRELKRDVLAPAVVVYSAYAGASLIVPCIVAGADALVDKAAPVRELFEAIRCVAGGRPCLPSPLPEVLAAARTSLAADAAILDRLLDGDAPARIARTLGLARPELEQRIDAMLARLSARVAVGAPPPNRLEEPACR